MHNLYQVPKEDIEKICWQGDFKDYDYQLFQLGIGYDEFIVINPAFTNLNVENQLKLTANESNRCIVWKYKDHWVAKYFNKDWINERRYIEIDLDLKLEIDWQRNPELDDNIIFNRDPSTTAIEDLYDLNYEMIWYVDPKYTNDKIWAYRGKLKNAIAIGAKDMGYVSIPGSDQLDVIFISYNEPNAEENWRRVLEKSPKAFRVNGINGIVNAHKCAAELATTDMFYVVDGDAYLLDEWDFTYQPNIFDRDCVHVWHSRNPINNLEYGYGGVKLIPKFLMLKADSLCVDMTTNISSKFKVINKVSNITAFNTNEFNTWRSAFRECAKLASNNSNLDTNARLEKWCTIGSDKPFGQWSIDGALAGKAFAQNNINELHKINNNGWIKEQFLIRYSEKH